MSWAIKCDICGNDMDDSNTVGHLRVLNFNDGYNTDNHDCVLDICEECLFNMIDKDVIASRSEF